MELNREQIKKALECCFIAKSCEGCPYECGNSICRDKLGRDALSLIKELTEENKVRKGLNTMLDNELRRLGEENERLQKALNTDISIVRVSRGSGKTAHLREVGRIKADAIRASAVRDMQKRFNEKVAKLLISPSIQYQSSAFIDQIAKEMLEGKICLT